MVDLMRENISLLLLEEVFIKFCKYWNYDPEQLNLNLEKNEKESKSKAINRNNERKK